MYMNCEVNLWGFGEKRMWVRSVKTEDERKQKVWLVQVI